MTFISNVFSNWKDATVKFKAHESSKSQTKKSKPAVEKVIILPKATQCLAESLSTAMQKEQVE